MFGAIGVLAALHARQKTGHSQSVTSALFENNVFLVAQHMMQFAVTGKPAAPMPSRVSAWGIYDVFTVKDQEQIFLSVVSDTQWQIFCDEFDQANLFADERLTTNNQRVQARDWLMPILRDLFATESAHTLSARFEARGLPYAPITRPQDLFDDPHLKATGGLAPMHIHADCSAAGQSVDTLTPLLPLVMDDQRLGIRRQPPSLGGDTDDILSSLGYSTAQTDALKKQGVIR
jgi:crotonobetainyl-CoA:carnitine CoA-transferase CaiB-like acyl-CoA transferase